MLRPPMKAPNTNPPRVIHALVLLYAVLALIYAYATPLFEAPDELYHFAMIDTIARTGALPVQDRANIGAWRQEGSQPPLYYLLAAPVVRLFDTSDFLDVQPHNPHVNMGVPGAVGNKNRILHDAPYQLTLSGTRGAVYAARLISIVLGGVTVFAVYQTARVLMPARPEVALVAAALTAFNPQFLFITASINNDNLVTALNSLTLWQTLALLRDGFRTRRSVILAVLVALATLSKLSGLVMVVTVTLAALWVAYRRRDLRGLITLGGLMLIVWAALAGWWYARNLTLYGELFGTGRMLDIFGRRPEPLAFAALLNELASLRVSYWGVFGWFNVYTLAAFYVIIDALMLAALVGVMLALVRGGLSSLQRAQISILMVALAGGVAALIAWTLQTTGSQGRLLFPYAAATSTLLALGLAHITGRRARWIAPPLALFAAAVPFLTLIPTYQPPRPLDALPADVIPLDARFDDIRLIGYQAAPARYAPRDAVHLTLYWQPLRSSPRDYSLYVHLVDETSGAIIGRLDTFPALGRLRTTTWTPDAIYADAVIVTLDESAQGAGALNANVGWWDREWGLYLDAALADGRTQSSISIPLGGYSDGTPPDTGGFALLDAPPRFGDLFTLRGWRWRGDTLELLWESLAAPQDNFTVLAAALREPYTEGGAVEIIAQGDAPPALPTRYWRSGEHFITAHTLTLPADAPPAAYPVYIAWYSLTQPLRLPTGTPADMVQITEMIIPAPRD